MKFRLAVALLLTGISAPSWAINLEWSGLYRIEGHHIKNSELDNRGREKSYGLHHLILRPKVIAADGLTISSQFNIFNQPVEDARYGNSQIGQFWGSGIGKTRAGSASTDLDAATKSNLRADNQASETLQISQLYLSYHHEFGSLLVGRAPMHFGLGISYNAGQGLFDHWFDTRDLVAYRLVVGNFSVMPILAKVSEGNLARNDDITEYMMQVGYEDPEKNLEFGLLYAMRRASEEGNDTPFGAGGADVAGDFVGGGGATRPGRYSDSRLSFYALQDTKTLRMGAEGILHLSGSSGVQTSTGQEVKLSGRAFVGEIEWRPEGKAWNLGAKSGLVSGDDPTNQGDFGAYYLDRNYDVAYLLFNHPLGQRDFLNSSVAGGGPNRAGDVDSADTEVISNAIFLAPHLKYHFSDRWQLKTRFVTGWLQQDAVLNQQSRHLGYELDLELGFTPKKGILWQTEIGLLSPGAAFKGDGSLPANFAYGIGTRAAISF